MIIKNHGVDITDVSGVDFIRVDPGGTADVALLVGYLFDEKDLGELIEALQAARAALVRVPSDRQPDLLIDRDGSRWYLRPDGTYSLTRDASPSSPGYARDVIERGYGIVGEYFDARR